MEAVSERNLLAMTGLNTGGDFACFCTFRFIQIDDGSGAASSVLRISNQSIDGRTPPSGHSEGDEVLMKL